MVWSTSSLRRGYADRFLLLYQAGLVEVVISNNQLLRLIIIITPVNNIKLHHVDVCGYQDTISIMVSIVNDLLKTG